MDSLKKLYELYDQQIADLKREFSLECAGHHMAEERVKQLEQEIAALKVDIEYYEAMKDGTTDRVSYLNDQITTLMAELKSLTEAYNNTDWKKLTDEQKDTINSLTVRWGKAEKGIAMLTKQLETHKRLNAKYPHGANGCCCLFDDEENPISWCKPHADLRDENLRLVEQITDLKAEGEKYKAFWEQSRLADQMTFNEYGWKGGGW